MIIDSLRHAFPEPEGFCIDRPLGPRNYTFLHFLQSMELNLNGENVITLPNAVIIYDKTTPQYFKAHEPILHNWMHLKDGFEEYMNKYGLEFDIIYYPENPVFITEIMYEMEYEFYGNRSNGNELLNLKLEELMIKLARALTKESIPALSFETKARFQSLRTKMLSFLNKHWTTEEMAEFVGFSKSHFYHTYKSIYGISPTNDIINARIESAEQLLLYDKKGISEIAELLGYENTTHFIRQFKSKTGFSPSEYRKLHKI